MGHYRPIPPSRPAMSCRIGPLSIRSSSARGLKQLLWEEYGAIPIAVTATPSSATVTSPGVSCKSAPCARSIRRGKSSLSTTAGPRCPSCRRPRVRSVRHKSLSPCSVRPTTPLPRPPGHSHCRTGCKAMSVPLSFRRDTGTADPRQPQERCQQGLPIRSRAQPQLPAVGRALSGGGDASSSLQAQGQGQGGGGCADRRALDLARLRHQTFFSLAELNQCIRALLNELNERPFKQLPGNGVWGAMEPKPT